jgi:predicted DNA-binding antitoxin AbrB/MazE fold protein
MKRIIEATVVNGTLRPCERLELPEGATCRIVVLPDTSASPEDARVLANEIYSELSGAALKELEQVALTSRGYSRAGKIDRAE